MRFRREHLAPAEDQYERRADSEHHIRHGSPARIHIDRPQLYPEYCAVPRPEHRRSPIAPPERLHRAHVPQQVRSRTRPTVQTRSRASCWADRIRAALPNSQHRQAPVLRPARSQQASDRRPAADPVLRPASPQSGRNEVATATTPSSTRPTSEVSRDTSSPLRIRSCQRKDRVIVRWNIMARSEAADALCRPFGHPQAGHVEQPDGCTQQHSALHAASARSEHGVGRAGFT